MREVDGRFTRNFFISLERIYARGTGVNGIFFVKFEQDFSLRSHDKL